MNNEPVALTQVEIMNALTLGIPLYTHPVKELDEQFKKGFEAGKKEGWKAHKFHHPVKELTDEEIISIGEQYWNGAPFKFVEFARAILRKAQEK